MNEPRESDLLEAQLDLVDLSAIDEENKGEMDDTPEMHQVSSISKGFCVKDFEEKMNNLKKENFNLKLRLYFLEQHNTLPEGIENFQKQFIELKNENETLSNDLKEKQDLLQQASIALELLEEEKLSSITSSEVTILELKNKLQLLKQENVNLQQALSDLNKSNLGNDTGYAEFLGAVDLRDIEMQRKMLEMTQQSEDYKQQLNKLGEEMQKFKNMLKESEAKVSMLEYERAELNDKLNTAQSDAKNFQRKVLMYQEILSEKNQDLLFLQSQNERFSRKIEMMNEKCEELDIMCFEISLSTSDLKIQLDDFKEKWATAECELHDVKNKLTESEDERQKTVKCLTQCLQKFNNEREKVVAMEAIIQQHQSSSFDKNDAKKDAEIYALRMELEKTEQKLKMITSSELKKKDQEIEKLTKLLNQLKLNESSMRLSETPRFSFDYLYESFNDLKFQQALEIKKQSQQKINDLMQELVEASNSKTKEQVTKLKEQMAIVVEKQEIADNALNRCAELCSFTLEHLHELTQFLTALLQNKEIRESLSNQSLMDIQNILEKSIDISRYSVDGRMSALPDLSMLGSLINTTRESFANIRERHNEIIRMDQAIQSSFICGKCSDLENKFKENAQEFEELKRVNQLLEDEICEYRNALECRDNEIKKCQEDLKFLKESEAEINNLLEDSKKTIQSLNSEKINIASKLEMSQETIQKLEKQLNDMIEDVSNNWMTKEMHQQSLDRIRDEVVNAEAQTAAIRLELEEIRSIYPKYKLNSTKTSLNSEDMKENVVSSNNLELEQYESDQVDSKLELNESVSQVMTTIECSEDKNQLALSAECKNCPKYQAQVHELKKYLKACYIKLQAHASQKAIFESKIQKQLSKTEDFLCKARSNMENVLKNKENKENSIK